MGEAGDQCTVCFTGTLQLHEGMLVCDVCGSVFQGFAEETQEYQTGISDAKYFRKSEAMKTTGAGRAGADAEPPPPPPVAEAVRGYVRSIQRLLQRQARVMVTELGVHPALPGAAREVWLAHLAHTRLLEPATTLKLEALAEQADPAATATEAGASESEAVGGGGGAAAAHLRGQMSFSQRRSFRVQSELGPLLSLRHTLALLLVAAWWQGEAVSPIDVARWALDGRLPYLAFAAEEGAELEQYNSILGRMLTSAKGVPSPRALWQFAAELAATLGVACPPLSPALWLQRYLAELQLPPQLLPVALQLHQLYQPMPLLPAWTRARSTRHPWARLMAALVVAVKLCYGLDGAPRGMAGLPPPPSWPDWAPVQLARLGSLSAFPLTLDEAAQLDGPRLRAYLTYLRRGLLADCAPPPELQTIHRLFERLALPPEPPAAGEQAGGSGEQAGDDVGGGGGGGGEEPMAVDAPQPGSSAAEELAGSVEGQPGGEWTEGRAGEAEVESAGGGGAPRTGYLFYAPGAASKALFHPDYALLLTACAPLVWLAPEALHEAAASLESRMIGAECEVSFLYNAEEQARLARLQEEAAWLKQREAEQRGERQRRSQTEGQQPEGRRRARSKDGGMASG